jgi:hypothetical protein
MDVREHGDAVQRIAQEHAVGDLSKAGGLGRIEINSEKGRNREERATDREDAFNARRGLPDRRKLA